ncbi:MAG: hypothetical protein CFH21_00389 [Alphaproteobacteria bacterium MarineAlpha5_Bin11]|nr:MAG: hypothetical protein CFH21_00389 [Alphaproteobacteria bacterium MarineAlpha5_Bin11]
MVVGRKNKEEFKKQGDKIVTKKLDRINKA